MGGAGRASGPPTLAWALADVAGSGPRKTKGVPRRDPRSRRECRLPIGGADVRRGRRDRHHQARLTEHCIGSRGGRFVTSVPFLYTPH